MTGRHDSIFAKYLVNNNLRTSLGNENHIKQLDVLDNGDILMAGYYIDSKPHSLTFGQWGWLMRTDSLGCFINNCSVPTYNRDDAENASKIEIFPNPANNLIQINFNKEIGVLKKLSVSDITGRVVKNINLQIDFYSVDVKGLPNGLYFLIFEFDTGRVTKKFIINR